MEYKVKLLRGTKVKPELVTVATVLADEFIIASDRIGIAFYNVDKPFLRAPVRTLVAFYPGGEWIIE